MNLRPLILAILLPSSFACGQVTLPKVLSDHMVIQRDLPVHIWGDAPPGQPVTVYELMGLPMPVPQDLPPAQTPPALVHDPMDLANGGPDSRDNLYSFRMRFGARGD